MSIVSALNQVTSYLIDPNNHVRSESEQSLAWAVSITLCIGTGGIIHIASALWRRLQNIEENDTHRIIGELWDKKFKNEEENGARGEQDSPLEDIERVMSQKAEKPKNETPTPPDLKQTAWTLYKLFDPMNNKVENTAENLLKVGEVIANTFEKAKVPLNEVKDPEVFQILFKSRFLRNSIAIYAGIHQKENILKMHLLTLSKMVFDDRGSLCHINMLCKEKLRESLIKSLNQIREFFRDEGRSLSEVLKDDNALQIFRKSGRLKLVLDIYLKLLSREVDKSPQEPSREMDQQDFDKVKREMALQLAVDHAKRGFGFVTVLGLKDFKDDTKKLDLELKKMQFKESPDKGGDEDKFKDITDLRGMLKDDLLDAYLAKYEAEKRK